MLYLMYSKPWFREVKNFDDLGNEQLLNEENPAKYVNKMDVCETKATSKKRRKDKNRKNSNKDTTNQHSGEGHGVVGAALFGTATAIGVHAENENHRTDTRFGNGSASNAHNSERSSSQPSKGKPTALAMLFG